MTSDRWLGAAKLREKSWWVDCETERETGRNGDGWNKSNRSDVIWLMYFILIMSSSSKMWPLYKMSCLCFFFFFNCISFIIPLYFCVKIPTFRHWHCWLLFKSLFYFKYPKHLIKSVLFFFVQSQTIVITNWGDVIHYLVYALYSLDIIFD